MHRVEFFYDCSSPWTYLAFHRIEDVCRRAAAALVWKPILVGGVFNAVNASVYEQRANPIPPKARYYLEFTEHSARCEYVCSVDLDATGGDPTVRLAITPNHEGPRGRRELFECS